ncbi:hypothetical protein [Micromonospora haikouensis]|uniref:hypothetical protein n=1 Tax=Micromonospora haikouensis TaxID=686309 RepID=UPI003D75AE20
MIADVVERLPDAEPEHRHPRLRGGGGEVRELRVVEEAGVEQRLVDQPGLHHPERGGQQTIAGQPPPVRRATSRTSRAAPPYSGARKISTSG